MADEKEKKKQVISLKLLVDPKANKVMFAEARKEFVDFIFHTLSLPLGTVVKLLNNNLMVGCLGDLYKSVDSRNTQYFHSDVTKDSVLNPKSAVNVPLLSLNEAFTTANDDKQFYLCESEWGYVTDVLGNKCPNCLLDMRLAELCYVGPTGSGNTASSSSGNEGFVKGLVTFMVMDNLEVKPMSTISGITLIHKFNVKDVSSLVEMELQVGLKEVSQCA